MELKTKLLFIKDEAKKVRSWHFQKENGFVYQPGQFYMFNITGLPLWRSYSIASSPTEKDIVITALLEGRFTGALFALQPGMEVSMKGPFGRFVFNENVPEDVVFLTGGIGVTPFRSMIKYAVDKQLPNHIYLFYSARRSEDLAYMDEFKQWEGGKVHCYFTVTRPDEEWEGPTGRLTWDVIMDNIKDASNKKFYICSSVSFAEGMNKLLLDNGVEKGQIRLEKWGVHP